MVSAFRPILTVHEVEVVNRFTFILKLITDRKKLCIRYSQGGVGESRNATKKDVKKQVAQNEAKVRNSYIRLLVSLVHDRLIFF